MAGVAAHWLLGEAEKAERYYPLVESVPEALKSGGSDPHARAALWAFGGRRRRGWRGWCSATS